MYIINKDDNNVSLPHSNDKGHQKHQRKIIRTPICGLRRALALVLPLLLLVGQAAADISQPILCDSCGCLDGQPFLVDCTETGMSQVNFEKDTYPWPWVVIYDDNPITHIPEFPEDDELIKLSFRNTPISSIADGAFANLTRLQSLDLSYGNLTKETFTKDAFRGPTNMSNHHSPLSQLEELDISHNKIEALDGHAFNHLILLRTLIMKNNPIHDFNRQTINAFSELMDLKTLDLSWNQLVRLPDQFLAGMGKLEVLVLTGNMLETVPVDIRHAKSLKILILDMNPIVTLSSFGLSSFKGPKSLEELSLSHLPELMSVEREAFTGLVNLTKLTMTNNPKLTSIDKLAFISNESNLKEIYLQNNALTTLDEDMLDWDSLTVIDLQHNPWSCDCNFQWFTDGPLQTMIADEPKLTRYVVCAQPNDVTGVNVKQLVVKEYEFPCPPSPYDYPMNSNTFGPLIVITLAIGILLLVSATMLCTYVLYQKSRESHMSGRTVHYRRATENDLESIAQRIDA